MSFFEARPGLARWILRTLGRTRWIGNIRGRLRLPLAVLPLASSHDSTRVLAALPALQRPPRMLFVICDGQYSNVELPASGTLVIGRGRGTDIRLTEAGVSRRHALVELGPARVTLRDLGSANGTRLGDLRLRPDEVAEWVPGVAAEIGAATLLLPVTSPEGPMAAAPGERSHDRALPEYVRGESLAMRTLYKTVERVAPADINVLILGETGVGKDVIAETLHRLSPRRAKPFLRLNCATLSEQLLESDLFGHERGAFTGAIQAKIGLLEAAEGGTVFLDEIGEMPLGLQSKLLLVLEERRVRSVGSLKSRAIDVRFVSATNQPLAAPSGRARFRDDLYFRLSGISLMVPSLRERLDEIEALAWRFLQQSARSLARFAGREQSYRFSPEAIAHLRAWHWPGNIRELKNVIARAVLLASGNVITPGDLGLERRRDVAAAAQPTVPPPAHPATDVERCRIEALLDEHNGNQTLTAQALGVARNTLIARMKKHGILGPRQAAGRRGPPTP